MGWPKRSIEPSTLGQVKDEFLLALALALGIDVGFLTVTQVRTPKPETRNSKL